LVRSLSARRTGSPERSSLTAGPGLERIPEPIRGRIIDLALEEPNLSPRALADMELTRFSGHP